MKFNMGCGHNKRPGYVNVDASPACAPDEVWNLENTPWPWPSGCAEEMLFIHSLEHMGGRSEVFLEIIKEIYRVAAPGCRIVIQVPHPRHDYFLDDPTHVRPITPNLLRLFDRDWNDELQRLGASNTPLAHYTGVHLKVVQVQSVLAEPYRSRHASGELVGATLDEFIASRNNVIEEFRIALTAVK